MSDEGMVAEIIEILAAKNNRDYQSAVTAKRAAHPKTLGLLKGFFKIAEDLPDQYQIGLFSKPKLYPALIRMSNSNPIILGDNIRDLHGCSIKVLFDDTKQKQDFVLTNTPTVPLGTLEEFYEAIYYGLKKNPLRYFIRMLFSGRIGKLIKIIKKMKHDTSPLDIQYWSTTPYRFGNEIVKYILLPKSKYRSPLPKPLTANYLTENMAQHLSEAEAIFDFCVQFQNNSKKMPVDDISVEWKQKDSPYIKVAELYIPKQDFQTVERMIMVEKLLFSPGNYQKQHEPIGRINKARIKIYHELANLRCQKNNEKLIQPSIELFNYL